MGPLSVAVSENVKRLRAEHRMTREELSAKLATVGVKMSALPSIRMIEEGKRKIDIDEVVGFSKVFGAPIEILIDVSSADAYRKMCLQWLLAEAEWKEAS